MITLPKSWKSMPQPNEDSREYRLPTRGWTTDVGEYTRAWDRLVQAGARILDLEPLGCDPGVCFHTGVGAHPVAGLSPQTIERLIELESRAAPSHSPLEVTADEERDRIVAFLNKRGDKLAREGEHDRALALRNAAHLLSRNGHRTASQSALESSTPPLDGEFKP
jgi:hypothetical protein